MPARSRICECGTYPPDPFMHWPYAPQAERGRQAIAKAVQRHTIGSCDRSIPVQGFDWSWPRGHDSSADWVGPANNLDGEPAQTGVTLAFGGWIVVSTNQSLHWCMRLLVDSCWWRSADFICIFLSIVFPLTDWRVEAQWVKSPPPHRHCTLTTIN